MGDTTMRFFKVMLLIWNGVKSCGVMIAKLVDWRLIAMAENKKRGF
jgi:hypothetical protein